MKRRLIKSIFFQIEFLSILFVLESSLILPFAHSAPNTPTLPYSINLPCLQPAQAGASKRIDLQLCSATQAPPSNTGPQSNTLKSATFNDYLNQLKIFLGKKLSCYYQGYIIKDENKTCEEGALFVAPSFKAVCNLADGEGSAANPNNHLNQNCGDPSAILNSEQGKWETAESRGLLTVQSLKYYANQVINNEILKLHQLNITHSECSVMAQDYIAYLNEGKVFSDKITQSINAIPMEYTSGQLDLCSVQLPGISSQVGCYMNTARAGKIHFFFNIAKCEINARMDDFYSNFTDTVSKQTNSIVADCFSSAIQKGTQVGNATNSRSAGELAGQNQYSQCYAPKVRAYYQSIIDNQIPGTFRFLDASPHGTGGS